MGVRTFVVRVKCAINNAGTGALLRIYTHADCNFKNLREIRLLYKVF